MKIWKKKMKIGEKIENLGKIENWGKMEKLKSGKD